MGIVEGYANVVVNTQITEEESSLPLEVFHNGYCYQAITCFVCCESIMAKSNATNLNLLQS